jgi:hypothetical protein
LLLAFNEARMQQKMEALDLSIGIKSQKRFVNVGCLYLKGRKDKSEEDELHYKRLKNSQLKKN